MLFEKQDIPPANARELKVLNQIDGHWCDDWDGLAVSASTPEYQCCGCYPKSRLGRIANWFFMFYFNHIFSRRRYAKNGFYFKSGSPRKNRAASADS